jgi:hypothetical protein
MHAKPTCTIALLALILGALLTLPAVAGEEGHGKELMKAIEKGKPYTEWRLWPGTEEYYEGTSPHGKLLTTYVNDTAYEAIKAKNGPLPAGSIVVKENYSPDKELMAVTTMEKKADFAPESGDWYYLKHTPKMEIQAAGNVDSCRTCHAKAAQNDYLFTSPVMPE